MHWVLQENLFKETEWENLVGCLDRFNIPYSIHKVIPFVGELVPPVEPKDKKVICFGSYSMRRSAVKNNWQPGVYDLEPINFKVQLEHWGDLMLNADSVISRFEDAKFPISPYGICSAHAKKNAECSICAVELPELNAFIRPIEDSKVFAGRVFDYQEFTDWQRKVCVLEEDFGDSLTKDTLVQVCCPKKIYAEYRFWVVDGKLVTASLYKRGDRVIYSPNVDQHVWDFAQSVIKHGDITCSMGNSAWQPHRAWVLDVCETDEGMKIVEINTINASGFYAGNVTDIVMALETMERFAV